MFFLCPLPSVLSLEETTTSLSLNRCASAASLEPGSMLLNLWPYTLEVGSIHVLIHSTNKVSAYYVPGQAVFRITRI